MTVLYKYPRRAREVCVASMRHNDVGGRCLDFACPLGSGLYKSCIIAKTCLYNFDPLKPHFYIVKLGLTRVYIIFLFLLKNKDCGYSLEPPRRGGSNEYPQSMF